MPVQPTAVCYYPLEYHVGSTVVKLELCLQKTEIRALAPSHRQGLSHKALMLVLLVGFRGAEPLPCDVSTGQESRWRLQYEVYQYFLPEGDLTEASLLRHLQRMAQVPQVKASAVKVSLDLAAPVAGSGALTRC